MTLTECNRYSSCTGFIFLLAMGDMVFTPFIFIIVKNKNRRNVLYKQTQSSGFTHIKIEKPDVTTDKNPLQNKTLFGIIPSTSAPGTPVGVYVLVAHIHQEC